MWWMMVTAAVAGSGSWTLDDRVWWADDAVQLDETLSTVTLHGGTYVFQIADQDVVIGAVIVGAATWEVQFAQQRDARATANRLVVTEGAEVERLRPIAEGDSPLALAVDRGLLLGRGTWAELHPHLLEVKQHGGVLLGEIDGREEVLVADQRGLHAVRRLAERMLRERTEYMREVHFDPAGLLEADAWRGAGTDPTRVFELHTDQSWDRFAGATDLRVDERWLTYLRDPAGWIDPQAYSQVLARTDDEGRPLHRVLTRERRAPQDGLRLPDKRVDLVAAGATAVFAAVGTAASVTVRVVADAQLQAVGESSQVVLIDLPHTEQRAFLSNPPLKNGFVFLGATDLQGTALHAVHLPLVGDQTEGRGRYRTFAVRLPEPLAAGERTTVRLAWEDHHRLAHVLHLDNGSARNMLTAAYDLGTATDFVSLAVRVRGSDPTPAPMSVRAGVPGPLQRYKVSMPGAQGTPEVRGAHRWSDTVTDTAGPSIALGRWGETLTPAGGEFPAVRTLLRDLNADDVPATVRQLVSLSQSVYPKYPADEVEIVELHDWDRGLTLWLVGGGLMGLNPLNERAAGFSQEAGFRNQYPELETWMLAASLHGHYWSGRGVQSTGLADGALAAWGIWVVGLAHGDEAEARWWDTMHERAAPSSGRVSVTDGDSSIWDAGYLVGRTLVAEVGRPAVVEATSALLHGTYPPTWEGLRAALENITQRDLSHVFEVWVDAGLAPDVHASLVQTPAGLVVEATSNVPFGMLKVPVEVRGVGDALWTGTVEVTDGSGHAAVRWTHDAPAKRVVVDPDRHLLLKRLD